MSGGSASGWAIPEDGEAYFRREQKRTDSQSLRPAPRTPMDLVGPGFARETTRVDNFSDPLALNNGFFSAAPGAYDAPNDTHPFVFSTIGDSLLGGFQDATSLVNANRWRRLFLRNGLDPTYVQFTTWVVRN